MMMELKSHGLAKSWHRHRAFALNMAVGHELPRLDQAPESAVEENPAGHSGLLPSNRVHRRGCESRGLGTH